MKSAPLHLIMLPDTRGVEISRFGYGNSKLGYGVLTFSREAGQVNQGTESGTCPGATLECESICYAKRINGPVREIYRRNSGDDVPPIPDAATLLRIHVSGDFDSEAYIRNWIERLRERPDVTAWAYTKSWRVPELLPALEDLRALPNVQLFASMDASSLDEPPSGWRRAWIWRDEPNGEWPVETRLEWLYLRKRPGTDIETHGADAMTNLGPRMGVDHNMVTFDSVPAYICPEETGRKANCAECGYCFEGSKHDVVFLEH